MSLGLATSFSHANWTSTSGLLFDLAGVVQLGVAGFFERIMEEYGDEAKYPYGPPSRITREIIDDPDRPRMMWAKGTLFYNAQMGFWLIVIGFVLQLAGVWLPSA